MTKALVFFGVAVLAGSVLVAATLKSVRPAAAEPAATSAPPAEGKAAPVPDDAAALLASQVAELRARNDELARRVGELEPIAKVKAAHDAEEKDPATRPYAGTKLMDDKLREKLKLTPEQELAMRAAILKYLKETQAVWADKTLAFAQKEAQVEALKQALEPQFQQILDSIQYAEMSAERQTKREKQREAAVTGEAGGYKQFFALDAGQGQALESIVRAYYAGRPQEKPGYKWQYNPDVLAQVYAIPGLSAEQMEKIRKHFDNLNGMKK